MLARVREEGTVLLWPCRGSCCWIQDPRPVGDFCGANPKFLWPFANESSVVFKLKQVGEASLSSVPWKMWRASMFGFVRIQSNKINHMDVGTKIVCDYHLERKPVILVCAFSFSSLLDWQ